jgi:hypothetical protein
MKKEELIQKEFLLKVIKETFSGKVSWWEDSERDGDGNLWEWYAGTGRYPSTIPILKLSGSYLTVFPKGDAISQRDKIVIDCTEILKPEYQQLHDLVAKAVEHEKNEKLKNRKALEAAAQKQRKSKETKVLENLL